LDITFKSIINDSYSRDISIKTRSALAVKRNNGDYIGACPVYGYFKSDDNKNKLVIDEYAAGIIREIFRLKIEGLSAGRIAEILNERGILSPFEYKKYLGLKYPKNSITDRGDAKWSVSTILGMLKNEAYTGTLLQGVNSTPNYKLKERIINPADEWVRTENAHEAIIPKGVFDLTQRVLRLDTRTSPKDDKVNIFSGILICGSCGNCMSRKTVPYKGIKYFYFWCPTTKKRGCIDPVMIKEEELTECVLDSLKAHISNVASVGQILAGLDPGRVAREYANRLDVQIAENERQLERANLMKSSLHENLINGKLSKEDHRKYKAEYTEDVNNLITANELLRQEINDILSCKNERVAWLEHFKEFSNLKSLDRKTVINLIHTIKIISKIEMEIAFAYQAEFETALSIIQRSAI